MRSAGAASVALHALVLGWLGLHAAPASRPAPAPEEAPLMVELVRALPDARSRPAPRTAAPRVPPEEAAVLPRPRPAARPQARLDPRPPLPLSVPAGGAGRGTAAGPSGIMGAPPSPGPLPGREMQGDLRGFLRATVGCSHEEYLRLSTAERARCDAGFAEAAKTAPPLAPPDDKLAAFARQADANARARARREGSLENTLPPCPPDAPGSNLGISCLPPQAHSGYGRYRDDKLGR